MNLPQTWQTSSICSFRMVFTEIEPAQSTRLAETKPLICLWHCQIGRALGLKGQKNKALGFKRLSRKWVAEGKEHWASRPCRGGTPHAPCFLPHGLKGRKNRGVSLRLRPSHKLIPRNALEILHRAPTTSGFPRLKQTQGY